MVKLLFATALVCLAAAPAFAAPAPVSPRDAASTAPKTTPAASQTTNVATVKGKPRIDPKNFGELNLDKLPKAASGERMVAMVDGEPITESRFLSRLRRNAGPVALDKERGVNVRNALAAPTLEQLILSTLYENYAQKNNIAVTDVEVTRRLEELNAQRPAGQQLQDLARAVGNTTDDVRQEVREMLIKEHVDKVVGDQLTSGTPTDEQINQYLREVPVTTSSTEELRASHIVFRAKPDMNDIATSDALARAEMVLGKIRGGMSFEEAARTYSQDRITIPKDGDVGYFTSGQMFPAFEEAARNLKVGEVSGIVRTPVGFHIIKLTERNPDNRRSLTMSGMRTRNLENWRRQQLEQAEIERYL